MDEPVEDGIRDRRLAEGLVPVLHRQLARDDRRAQATTVLDDLEQVGRPWCRYRLQASCKESISEP